MSPQKIIKKVLQEKIDVIAISDHNSLENVGAVIKAAAGFPLTVLPGMEICTREEIHVVAFFENLESASALQRIVFSHLHGENNPDIFGMQIVANEHDEVVRFNNRLLIGATDLSIEQIIDTINELDGIAIAAHIDREAYSVIGQLGFIPDTVKFDALEISVRMMINEARKKFSDYHSYPFIQNSDAHFIDDIGKGTSHYLVENGSFGEIRKALRNEDGRKVIE